METLPKSTSPSSNKLTLFAEAFRANLSHLRGRERVLTMPGGSGPSSWRQFAKLDQNGCWLKMYQGCLQTTMEGPYEKLNETWPRWAIVLGTVAYELPMSVRTIEENESSLWPTMRAKESGNYQINNLGRKYMTLTGAVKMWPTPTTPRPHDSENTAGRAYDSQNQIDLAKAVQMLGTPTSGNMNAKRSEKFRKGRIPTPKEFVQENTNKTGQLNPTWVEWLMGFPIGWTDLNASETP